VNKEETILEDASEQHLRCSGNFDPTSHKASDTIPNYSFDNVAVIQFKAEVC